MAAAAYATDIAEDLVSRGAKVHAKNRRGAEPLHYAADGIPGSPRWDPGEQDAIIRFLIKVVRIRTPGTRAVLHLYTVPYAHDALPPYARCWSTGPLRA